MQNQSSLETLLTEEFFVNQLISEQVSVNIFLISGIRLSGIITSFDHESIYLSGSLPQLIYKRAIATILPQP